MAFKKQREPDSLFMTTINVSRYYWPEFQKIIKTEGVKSVSLKLRDFVQAYVEEHKAGNPQTKVIHYCNVKTEQPIKVRCSYIQGASKNEVLCGRKGVWVPGVTCYSCPKNYALKSRKK